MTDLLVNRISFSDPSVKEFGASSPAAHDDDVERTPPRDETKPKPKPKENRPSDPVPRTMKAVLSCSPGNPKSQQKMKIRASRRVIQVQHALAGEDIVASKYSSKPGSPVGKQAAGHMKSVSPRSSPRVRRSIQWKQRKHVHIGSSTQDAEQAYTEENSQLLGDEGSNQADRATVAASPKLSPKMRRSKQLQQGSSTQEESEQAYTEAHFQLLGDKGSNQADRATVAASPRLSPKMRRSKQLQQGSSTQEEPEQAYTEANSPLLGDKGSNQADRAVVPVSPRLSPRMRRSKQWQKRNDTHGGRNTREGTEAYEEEVSIFLGDKRPDDYEPDNETDNCLVNPGMDQSSPPGNLLEETGKWTGEKRAKVIASPPTSEVSHDKHIDDPRDKEEFWDIYDDPEQLNKVHERLALYRIKANELFWEGKELDIAQLKEEYSSDTLRDEGYFEQYEMNREWYFNPEYCERSAFDDYQRLVLRKDVRSMSWESYHTTCTTLKCDQEFLQFYEELSSKLKSIEVDDVEPDKEHFEAQRTKYVIKAHIEAPKIAARFSSIYAGLVQMGITDCIWSAMFDLTYHKDLDHVFFEIWKRVAKDKVSFTDALLDVYKLALYPLQHRFIKAEFEERPLRSIKMKEAYYTHLAHINEKVPEDEVAVLIKEAVNKILPKPLVYVDYIRKKLEVAKEIGVIQ